MNTERQHFRIDLDAIIKFSELNDESEVHTLASEIVTNTSNIDLINAKTIEMNKQLQDAIQIISSTNIQLGHLMELFNRKINLLFQEIEQNRTEGCQDGFCAPQPVNLSGGGVLFYADHELESDTMLDLTLVFMPDYIAVRSISRVIKSFHSPADPNGTWKVASEFLHMHEDDRDRVVKIVLAEQAKMLRERKKQQYDDLN